MAEDSLITFVIDGPIERHGAIAAETFVGKVRDFIAMIYAFDRAFSKQSKKTIGLELVDLKRSSPARAYFRARQNTSNVNPIVFFNWTADQLEKIYSGSDVAPEIIDSQLSSLVNLAHKRTQKLPSIAVLQMEYAGRRVDFDETMEARALKLREVRSRKEVLPWYAGVSRGAVFGELRSVSDLGGERTFIICPPIGIDSIQCIFPERLRDAMTQHLFKVVRVRGFLHYNGNIPFPTLIDADEIEGCKESLHFSELAGLFSNDQLNFGDDEWLTT
jgi:hypothetical protein